ncbi:MAG: site-2 protease family protein, partial [Planctomycetota bacterium]|nr:site-2 protease family protein [Planctomycetota bacterium]
DEVILDIERKVDGRSTRLDAVKVATAHDSRMGARTIGLTPFREEVEWRLGFRCSSAVRIWLAREDALREVGLTESPAARAGLKDGDAIVAVDGRPVSSPGDLVEAVSRSGGRPIRITFVREGEERTVEAVPAMCSSDGKTQVPRLMLHLFQTDQVTEVDPESEAYAAGLRAGAYLMSVRLLRDRERVELAWAGDLIFDESGRPRPAGIRKATVPARTTDGNGPVYRTEMVRTEVIKLPFAEALSCAWTDVRYFATDVFRVVACLLTRKVEMKNVSGPLGIANLFTRVSREKDIAMYLWFVAFVSLNVGVLQLLPIPVLDGGHLALLAIEKLKGGPLSLRVQIAAQYVGLFIIAALFILATRNDIAKLISP